MCCCVVLNDAVGSLRDTISAVYGGDKLVSRVDGLRRRLSATATDQDACFDALEKANATIAEEIKLLMKNSTACADNSLAAIATNLTFGSSKIVSSASHHKSAIVTVLINSLFWLNKSLTTFHSFTQFNSVRVSVKFSAF
ncbi:hypothetical protein C2S51_010066 [Perilla frutescens var. frutescens]|nr:hypothetical protein C2S51_010066 [Perilla frutescens var. frutescens]